MKARVRTYEEGFTRGQQEGIRKALLFCLIAINDEYGYTAGPLTKIMNEALRIAEEAPKDPDWKYRMQRRLAEIGLPLNVLHMLFSEDLK